MLKNKSWRIRNSMARDAKDRRKIANLERKLSRLEQEKLKLRRQLRQIKFSR